MYFQKFKKSIPLKETLEERRKEFRFLKVYKFYKNIVYDFILQKIREIICLIRLSVLIIFVCQKETGDGTWEINGNNTRMESASSAISTQVWRVIFVVNFYGLKIAGY
jgi:hypothetical protein